ncbi:MAG: LacI family transcriptional regulator [Anaerolineales bacterium]|nr:LacI family transcriptional regulator [Anaerolineales bacterium]
MPVKIRDVAKKLGLSVTTVSRALGGYDDVAPTTRALVIETAREMGYVAQHAARQLRRQRTETIGLIFPTSGSRFSDPFFSEFIAGIGDETSRRSYDLLVSVAPPGDAEERAYRLWANSRRVDGFILVRMRVDDWRISYLTEENFPFASFGRSKTLESSPHIGVDGCSGIKDLVNHLLDLGHRRIAFIGASEELTLVVDRLEGYKAGLEEAHIAFDPDLVLEGDLTRAGGYEATKTLIAGLHPPTAIIGVNDLTALGAIHAAQESGLIVGKDLAIAGFDGTEAGEHAHPALTTVHQPVYEIGRRVSAMLIDLIEKHAGSELHSLIRPRLIVRESTLNSKSALTN